MPELGVRQSTWRHTLIHNLWRIWINGTKRRRCQTVTAAAHSRPQPAAYFDQRHKASSRQCQNWVQDSHSSETHLLPAAYLDQRNKETSRRLQESAFSSQHADTRSSIPGSVPRSTKQRDKQTVPGLGVRQSVRRHILIRISRPTSINGSDASRSCQDLMLGSHRGDTHSSITCGVPRSMEQRDKQTMPGPCVRQSLLRNTLIHNLQRA